MVRKASGIKSINDLDGKSVCVTENTTTEQMLKAVIHNRQLNVKIIYANGDSFFRGDCDAYTADRMNLATNRANRADNPSNYLILDETISREPIGPMVRNDDAQWAKIIRAVVNWMILAEEKGVSTKTLDEVMSNTQDPELKNVFGQTGNIAEQLGLPKEWASQVIRAVGNYGEVYDRHFGPNTAIGVERGLNRPWNEGGVLLSPLFK
jgi:general L-amino acid transport system substrate-binding protein